MKRLGLFGLVFAVSLLGACNDNGGGSGFAVPKGQLGEVNLFIGSPSRCVGGGNDGGTCDPNSDCQDGFCTLICLGEQSIFLCNVDADCTVPPNSRGNCGFGCDRGINGKEACSQDTNCAAGTCTGGLVHDFSGVFSYTGDLFPVPFSSNTDNDGDGFTPTIIEETAPLGTEGEILVDFLDDTPDCVRVTWGPQLLEVFSMCGDPIDATFAFPE